MRDRATDDAVGEDACSSSMMQDGETETDALRILYLHVAEESGGFVWQVRLHDVPDPLAIAARPFASDDDARDAGHAALDKACGQFRRFKVLE